MESRIPEAGVGDAPGEARHRLVLGLDVPDVDHAIDLARRLRPWFGTAKIGLELFSAAGPETIGVLRNLGYEVFADLKFHDIPTTVGRASRVVGALGVRYLNFHAAGGEAMLAEGVEGFREGAAASGHPDPVPLAVTVLTSDTDTSAFDQRLEAAAVAGCGGVVCSALEVERVKERQEGLVTVVPGTRPEGSDRHDQARSTTPGDAVRRGADLLVVARVVLDAPDPTGAAREVHDEVAAAVAPPRPRPG